MTTEGQTARSQPEHEADELLLKGRLREAEKRYLRAIGASPTSAAIRCKLAYLNLIQGRFGVGWLLYEARRQTPSPLAPDPGLSYPEWKGEPLAGRRIAVILEQGLGDQILFARYIPYLERFGAEVVYACDPRLGPLFPWSVEPRRSRLHADYWILLGSLPLRLNATEIPEPFPLRAEAKACGGIGVVPAGDPRQPRDQLRSLSPPAASRLLGLGRDLRPEATGAANFGDTAEIVAGLDLVISVDTAVANLAASMGKPTWVLLNPANIDFRWGPPERESLWHPKARRFWKTGAWESLIEEVAGELR